MSERTICVNSLLAWVGWGAALLLLAIDLWMGSAWAGRAGILCCAAGATLHIKGSIHALHEREVNAFNLGRDSAELRSLR